MKTTLTLQEKLKDLRVEKGLSLEQLEEATSISKSALGNYENDEFKEISHLNIVTLAKFYGVSTDYLLGLSENRKQQNTELSELQLSDEMIQKLKEKKFNTRLLNELVTNENFAKLMADMEIYIDGIASMQIQNLNSIVDQMREEIVKKYQPDDNELYNKTMEASHINEKKYFSDRIQNDLNEILEELRENHKKDFASAPEKSVSDKLQEGMREVSDFKGTEKEKKAAVYCRQLGIDYKKLSTEEFDTLIRILDKSKFIATPSVRRRKIKK